MKKVIFFTIFLFISALGNFYLGEVQALICADTECADQGMRNCQSNTYCCTGDGCPTYTCKVAGDALEKKDDGWNCCRWELINSVKWEWTCTPAIEKGTGTCTPCGGGGGGSCASCCVVASTCGSASKVGSVCKVRTPPLEDKKWCSNKSRCCPSNGSSCETSSIGTKLSTSKTAKNPDPYEYTDSIEFNWGIPKKLVSGELVTEWGTCCSNCHAYYRLFVDGSSVGDSPIGTRSANFDLVGDVFGVGSHDWYVLAKNGDSGSVTSGTKSFTVSPQKVDIQGYIWNATAQSCTSSPDTDLEIVIGSSPGNIAEDITVNVGAISGVWEPLGFSGYSYNVSGVEIGSHLLTANVPDPVGFPNSKYVLACVNGEEAIVASVDAQDDPTVVHLGYRITSEGWIQSINGDIYGGCDDSACIDSVSLTVPGDGLTLGGFVSYLISGTGTLFGDSGLSVSDESYSEDSNRRLSNMASIDSWPNTLSFNPPSSADPITNCSGVFQGVLEAGQAYSGSTSCVQTGLDDLSGNYDISGQGVMVIFVTDSGTLTFDKNFISSSTNKRILFVTPGSIEFAETIGVDIPTTPVLPADAQIQAGFIAEQSINFLTTGNEDDKTIIIEGPLATKDGTIEFNRDRGLANGFPAEVVVYNPIYLTSLSSSLGLSGVSTVDITWIIGN